jgi:hypothetical protein
VFAIMKKKNDNVSLTIKRMLRQAAGARSNCPIKIIQGGDAPSLKGHFYFWSNKSGDVIRYPNAYKRAWGKPIYNPSTIRVEVGSDWLLTSLTTNNVKELKLKIFK